MNKRRILIIRWGQIRIHDYYLANLFTLLGCEVEFALYTHSWGYKDQHIIDLLLEVKSKYQCYEFPETFFKKQFMRINTLIEKVFNKNFLRLAIGFFLPNELYQKINIENYDYVVPIEQYSLYWAAKAYNNKLHKLLYYSLEISKANDPDMGLNLRAFLKEEKKILNSGILGLIIQDKFRAEALLECNVEATQLNILYLPVFVQGEPNAAKSSYLFNKLNLTKNKKIILYFGEVYKERMLPELTKAFNKIENQSYVLVFHGSKYYRNTIKIVSNNIVFSEEFVPFSQLNQVISSAHIGLAFYDNAKLNSRYTAFSSEKITRYLQCGIPFIAFKNETYTALNEIAECAYLIENFSEFEIALSTVENEYTYYSNNALKAFNYFSITSKQTSLNAFFNSFIPFQNE